METIGIPPVYDSVKDGYYEMVVLFGEPIGARRELSYSDLLKGRVVMEGNTFELPKSILAYLGEGSIFAYFREVSGRQRMDDAGGIQSLPTVMELTGIVQLVSDQPQQIRGFTYSFPIQQAVGLPQMRITQILG